MSTFEEWLKANPQGTQEEYDALYKQQQDDEDKEKVKQPKTGEAIGAVATNLASTVADLAKGGKTGTGTAASALKGLGGTVGAIPTPYTAAIGGVMAGIGGILDMVDAKKQKKDAEEIQKKAEQVKKGALEPQYLQALRGYMMQAQSGMPSFEASKSALDASSANALKSIKESSPYGGTVVDAINATLNKQSEQQQVLEGQQGQFKFNAKSKALDYLSGVGDKNRELTIEQRKRQEALYSQAQDLLAASTANKQIGREKALGGGIMAAGGIAKLAGAGFKPSAKDGGMGATTDATSTTPSSETTDASTQSVGQELLSNIGTGGLDGKDLTQAEISDLQTQLNEMLSKGGNPATIASIRKILEQYSLQE